MEINKFIQELKENNINIELNEKEDLKISFPNDHKIDNELINKIKANKSDIINFFTKQDDNYNGVLTPFQEGLVSFVKNNPQSNRYILHLTYELDFNLEFKLFNEACLKLVQNHALLRSIFDFNAKENKFYYKVLAKKYLECYDLTSDQEDKFRKDVFEISEKPLIAFALINKNRIIVKIHHLIVDTDSVYIILGKLMGIYEQLQANPNKKIILEDRDNFAKYSKWIANQNKDKAIKYWQTLLRDAKPTLIENIVPKKIIGDIVNNFEEKNFSYTLSKDSINYFKNNKITLSNTVNFFIGFVLSKYYGENTFTWGNTITHRFSNNIDLSNTVGPCISTIPLTYNFGAAKSIGESLIDFQQQMLDSVNFSYLSINDIYKSLQVDTLFSVLVNYQDTTSLLDNNSSNNKFERKSANENQITSHFPIAIIVTTNDHEIDFKVSYDEYYFSQKIIDSIIKNVAELINNVNVSYNKELKSLNIFETEDVNNLSICSGYAQNLPSKNIIELFLDVVNKYPDRIAIEDSKDTKLTFKELDAKSNYIANILSNNKIQNSAVGTYIGYSAELIVTVIGILKSGNYLVNFEEGYPYEKHLWIINNTNLKACFYEENSSFSSLLNDDCLKVELKDLEEENLDIVNTNIKNDSLCALYYTSGSTGTPKVVKVSHQNTLNSLDWITNKYQSSIDDVYAIAVRLCFSPSIRNIFEPLVQGNKLIIFPDFLFQNVKKFTEFLSGKEVTRLALTPSFLNVLVENNASKFLQKLDLLELRGEAVKQKELEIIKANLPNTTVISRYGSTEASSTIYNDNINSDYEFSSLGVPVQNTIVSIVDQNLNVKPKNIIGEILVEGENVSEGYLIDAEKEQFISIDNRKLFKTGDLGFINENNHVFYIGRKNRMIKMRGFRIEPKEIECNIEEHISIFKAVVIATPDEKKLNAFVEIKEGHIFDEQDLKYHLKNRIPSYMIPNKIFEVDGFRYTNTRKIDLLYLDRIMSLKEASFSRETKSKTQEIILNIFQKVLLNDDIYVNEDFYSMGVDSIIMMKIIYQIELNFNIEINAAELFQYNTIEQLSNYIDEVFSNGNNRQIENFYILNSKEENKDVFFLVPPLTGVTNYQALGNFVPEKLDFVVFDTISVDDYGTIGDTMESLARFYVKRILELAIHKTIHLAGWSFGGSLCYEIAMQLQHLGYSVGALIMMDPNFYNSRFDNDNKTREDYNRIVCALLEEEGIDPIEFNTSRIIEQMYQANQITKKYKLKKYFGNIELLKPKLVSDFERNYGLEFNGLEDYCMGKINVSMVEGNHMTMSIGFGSTQALADTLFSRIKLNY
ncbi:hypothetical protein D1632_14420 [Chryseobacterium nematophagum]|uniref:Carrier domain-containing protein n=1 Tax=Chryseobacterium nematophagum TaxID=2305228 RepID=A0A3M7LBE0_9FLAO|nr:AMP-binding protein [Chryseobacterium nematophagum]RMZ58776.1 hypothetical protein D1632_14420 [Chryseobacterium nematophagum]